LEVWYTPTLFMSRDMLLMMGLMPMRKDNQYSRGVIGDAGAASKHLQQASSRRRPRVTCGGTGVE
jgi:hypothetical protein